jgi:LacI family repressor for deo operon, udp, cdd, tsx, nupC, and nupG
MDVAQLAGTSHETVSRYFRDSGAGMKAKTIERIEFAVKELDYHPNLIARSMRTRVTGRLAIVLPASNRFMPTRLLAAASAVAHENGFSLEIVGVEGGIEFRRKRIRELVGWGQVDGVMSISAVGDASELVQNFPLVVSADYDDDLRALGELADGSTAAEIIEYLANLGHRRFLHIAGSLSWASARNRKSVYLETIARLGLESFAVFDGDWSAQSGFDAVMGLPVDSGVTAVFAASDVVAMGALRAAGLRGWSIPGDLSVWGWDDEEFSRFTTPTLSTINVDREAQGRHSMLRLIAKVRSEAEPELPPNKLNRLVVRESTGPPPKEISADGPSR